MADEHKAKRLEIAHVLFMDIVGYSKLLTDEQSEALQELNQIVRKTEAAREADAAGELIILPTGDGMALVFTGSVEEPVECALEISHALRAQPSLPVRTGIHSGPVHHVKDANGRENIAGVGINIAQRVMDCGDAGHILVSKRVADDLAQKRRWQPYLHELGDVEVKHGVVVSLVNLYAETIGNPSPPTRVGKGRGSIPGSRIGTRKALSPLVRAIFAVAILLLVLAILSVIFAPAIMRTIDRRRSATLPQPSATASPSFADAIKGELAKKITDELHDALSHKENAAPEPSPAGSALPEKSIAVLPFVNMSSDKEQDYFSDGLSEELLNQLAQVPQLRVIARTSSFSFKGKEVDVATIARTLNVANVLEGSVRKSANTLRVTAQLVRASDSSHLWSQTYDRDLTDVFKVQDEIAGKVVAALKVTLLPTQELPKAQRINNPEAYQQYLQGRYYLNRFSIADFDKARAFLERACQLDPKFPLAWAALSRVWVLQTGWSDKLTRAQFGAGLTHGRDAADRALQLDPNLPEALSARFEIQFTSDFDWKGGAETIKRAKALAPSDPVILKSAGQVAVIFGNFAGAVELARQAVALDPVNAEVRAYLANALLQARRAAESRAEYERVAELNPSTPWAFAGGGMADLFEGKNAEALAAAERETSEFARLVVTAVALWNLGRKEESDVALATMIKDDADVGAFQIAEIYSGRGDKDKAFVWLDRARRQQDGGLAYFPNDPLLDPLRSDPRWATFQRSMGWAEDQLK